MRCRVYARNCHWRLWIWGLCVSLGVVVGPESAAGQSPRHRLHSTFHQAPGTIGARQSLRQEPIGNYFQPVHVRVPTGTMVSLATSEGFQETFANELLAGMLIGPVYRLRVTDIPYVDGVRLYPTVEVIDRLHPPPGAEVRFPIVVDITQDDLEKAASGTLVTRVIYLENPETPVPARQPYTSAQPYFDVLPQEDPLDVADDLGRPMAIVRIGSRTLEEDGGEIIDPSFVPAPSLTLDAGILSTNAIFQPADSPMMQPEQVVPEEPIPSNDSPAPLDVPVDGPIFESPAMGDHHQKAEDDSPIIARPLPTSRRRMFR